MKISMLILSKIILYTFSVKNKFKNCTLKTEYMRLFEGGLFNVFFELHLQTCNKQLQLILNT